MTERRTFLLDLAVGLSLTVAFYAAHFRDTVRGLPLAPEIAPLEYALVAACGLIFAFRSRWPRTYVGATVVLVCAYAALGYPPGPVYLAPFLALYVCFITVRQRYWLPIVVVCGAGFVAAINWQSWNPYWIFYTATLWFFFAAAIGLAVRLGQNRVEALTTRAELAEYHREQEARRRVAEERLRIAQELHDAVGHKLAVISLQAGVASHLAADNDQREAHEVLTAIRGVSNEALGELRSSLGLLRGDGEPGVDAPLAPAQGMADLHSLVGSMRAAGLDIQAEIDPDCADAPEFVSSACYRLVQECLTNAARHGDGTVRLRVAKLPKGIEIEAANPASRQPDSQPSGGRGILGMRERVGALGGSFHTGREPNGEFRVWAVLPMPLHPSEPVR